MGRDEGANRLGNDYLFKFSAAWALVVGLGIAAVVDVRPYDAWFFAQMWAIICSFSVPLFTSAILAERLLNGVWCRVLFFLLTAPAGVFFMLTLFGVAFDLLEAA